MSYLKDVDFLQLLDAESQIVSDFRIKFEDREDEIRLHKLVLSLVSPTFMARFYGPLSEHARSEGGLSNKIEVFIEPKYSFEALMILSRHIYGDKEIVNTCSRFALLFQVLDLAKMYTTSGLEEMLIRRIIALGMTEANVLPTLNIVKEYRSLDGFQKICDDVESKIVAAFSTLTSRARSKFYQVQRESQLQLVKLLMETMDKNHVEGETAKNTDLYVVDRNKVFKFYKEHQDDPATLGLLDNIMNHFVVLQTMDGAVVEVQRNKAAYSVQQRYW